MKARLQHGALAWFLGCAPILRAVRQHRQGQMGKFGKLFMVLGLIGSMAGAIAGGIALARTALGLGGALALIGGGMLAAFTAGTLFNVLSIAALQNTPAHAVLVPGLNRLVRRTAVLLWLAMMAAFALFASVIPHGALIPLAAHLFLLTLVSLRGYSAIAWMLLFPLQGFIDQQALYAFLEQPAVLALCYTGAMLMGWRALGLAFPSGGDGHFARANESRTSAQAWNSMAGWAQRERTKQERRPLYALLLAFDVKARRPAHLMMHVFGPNCQRTDFLVPWLMFAALALQTRLAVHLWWPQHHDAVAGMIMLAGLGCLVALPIMSAHRFAVNVPATAGEQALFQLTPVAPRPLELNRMLARTLLRTCLIEWLGSLLLLLGVAIMWGTPQKFLLAHISLMCAALAFVGWPLRDHARDSQARHALVLALAALVLLVGAIAFMSGGHYWVWAVLLAGSLTFIAHRYRTMLQAPPAFPARRLSAQ